jgi:hypothetical protein
MSGAPEFLHVSATGFSKMMNDRAHREAPIKCTKQDFESTGSLAIWWAHK